MQQLAITDRARVASSSELPRAWVSQVAPARVADAACPATVDGVDEFPRVDEFSQSVLSRIGSVVAERWHIDRVIGSGGMGVVYAATHRNGQRVALKFLRSEYACNAEVRERFLAEACIANRVDHPAVIRVSDDGTTEDGSLFLVMELLQGRTLEDQLRIERFMPLERAASILMTLLDVLDIAHKAGILHRDIKPANVFLCDDGSIRVLDFGVARAEGLKSHGTMTGITVGTPTFMSPEQAGGRWDEVDGRSDLFAVGATGYALLTGANIRNSDTCSEALLLAMTQQVPSVGELRTDLSPGWVSVIDCALRFAKEERFESAAAMRAALATCVPHKTSPAARAVVTSGDTLASALPIAAPLVAAHINPYDATFNLNVRHSVPAWQTEKSFSRDVHRSANGHWWRAALVTAALVTAPILGSLLSNDAEAPVTVAAQEPPPAVNQPTVRVAAASQPVRPVAVRPKQATASAAVPSAAATSLEIAVQPTPPSPVEPAALSTGQPTLSTAASAEPNAQPESAVAPRVVGRDARPLLRQRVASSRVEPPASVAPSETAKERLASALSEQLGLPSPGLPPVASAAPPPRVLRRFDPLERRN